MNTYHGVEERSVTTESFKVSVTRHAPNASIPKHHHPTPYLCYSIAGRYLEQSHQESVVSPGRVLYRQGGYEHANRFSREFGLCLNLEFLDPDSFENTHGLSLPKHEMDQKAATNFMPLTLSIYQALPLDVLEIQCYEAATAQFSHWNSSGNLVWVQQVMDYLNDLPQENVSLKVLSEEFQLHPNYIVRKFKAVTGLTMSQYLLKVKLERAAHRMFNTSEHFGHIAYDAGFYDQSHFNRCFKQQFGVVPKQFREMTKG